jgi:tRNA-splicing ligase RtcB
MIDAAAELLRALFGVQRLVDTLVTCDHNHVRRERHFGCEWWVHRKGAASARAGEGGIIPGSMGTTSYLVEGRGAADALCSSSHGAGRAMSRDEARRRVSGRDVARQLRDVWFDERSANELREEAPAAYKDVGAVMRAQRDLVRVVRRLQPVLSYKGT